MILVIDLIHTTICLLNLSLNSKIEQKFENKRNLGKVRLNFKKPTLAAGDEQLSPR